MKQSLVGVRVRLRPDWSARRRLSVRRRARRFASVAVRLMHAMRSLLELYRYLSKCDYECGYTALNDGYATVTRG